jgi:hypothetical protein
MVSIAVKDDGQGLPNVNGLRSFQLFNQKDNKIVYDDRFSKLSLGLGLCIVGNIINKLDGEFIVRSKEDGHPMTSFEFRLPYTGSQTDLFDHTIRRARTNGNTMTKENSNKEDVSVRSSISRVSLKIKGFDKMLSDNA